MGRSRAPSLFVSHGAPTLAIDAERGRDLAAWGRRLERPAALLVLSAHWEHAPVTIGTTTTRELFHDYAGFPPALAEVRYPAPAASELARRVVELLPDVGRQPDRPWDHGVWVPLVHLFPEADVPLLQISLPPSTRAPRTFVDLGRALAPLRDEGVLVMGSGGLVHNLRRLDWREQSGPPSWAVEFEEWSLDALARGDLDALADLDRRAPALDLAHPTREHLVPLLVAAGAAEGEVARAEVRGFEYGSLSRTSLQFG